MESRQQPLLPAVLQVPAGRQCRRRQAQAWLQLSPRRLLVRPPPLRVRLLLQQERGSRPDPPAPGCRPRRCRQPREQQVLQ